ncbi:MAG: hypothetical protein ABSD77_03790 [Verrucomicrobiota bacterium]|jgi:hypothetical protein
MSTLADAFIQFIKMSSAYFTFAGVILIVCGLPWIFIRKYISNPDLRRLFSSLVFALALTPGGVPFHNTAILVPAILMVEAIYPDPLCGLIVGIIILVWFVIFATRSLAAICYVWIKKKICKPR